MTSFSLLFRYWQLGQTCCHHLLRWQGQHIPSKRWHLCTKLHGVTSHVISFYMELIHHSLFICLVPVHFLFILPRPPSLSPSWHHLFFRFLYLAPPLPAACFPSRWIQVGGWSCGAWRIKLGRFNGKFMRTNEFTPCQVHAGNWLLGDGMSGGRWDSWLLSRLTQAPTQGI